ncbi:MAG: hypothetical protein WD055_02240 [Candidatus Dependentiae bacterium]
MHKQLFAYALLFLAFPLTIITIRTSFISSDTLMIQQKKDTVTTQNNTPPIKVTPASLSDTTASLDKANNQKNKKTTRVVTVKNSITKEMISYSKCFASYTPDFSLTINDQTIQPGEEKKINITNDQLTTSYSYNFLNGFKKGKRTVEFEMPSDKEKFEITFSWEDDWHVLIKNSKPIKKKKIH